MLGYRQIGNGEEKVLAVHGWKTDHTCYDSLFPSLNEEKYTYIFVDQRGYGKSKEMPGPYTVEQVAADMVELADDLGWQRFHIIGHSMGGKVIQRIMVDYPDRIKSGIGITPCPACKIPFDDEGWLLFSSSDLNLENRKNIFRHSTGNRLTDRWYEFITQKSAVMSTAQAFREYLTSWVNYEFVDAVQNCKTPIKIIAGEHDPDLSYEMMRETYGTWLPHSEIVQLKNCGHYPMLETPLSLAAEIEVFLDLNS